MIILYRDQVFPILRRDIHGSHRLPSACSWCRASPPARPRGTSPRSPSPSPPTRPLPSPSLTQSIRRMPRCRGWRSGDVATAPRTRERWAWPRGRPAGRSGRRSACAGRWRRTLVGATRTAPRTGGAAGQRPPEGRQPPRWWARNDGQGYNGRTCTELGQMVSISKYRSTTRYQYQTLKVHF